MEGELLNTFGNVHPLSSDGGFVICCSLLDGGSTISELTIFNPIVKTRKVLPLLPCSIFLFSILVNLVVDRIFDTYKIFLKCRYHDPVLWVFESTTNQWRSLSNAALRLKGGAGVYAHSVIFQGLLYFLSTTHCNSTCGRAENEPWTCDHPVKDWLHSYNFVEDSWKNTRVEFPKWLGNVRKELVVSENRLFLVSGDSLYLIPSQVGSNGMEDPLSVTEILVADRTLNMVSHLAEPLFDAQGVKVHERHFGFDQAFGFSNSIMFTCCWPEFSIVYNLGTCLWELWLADPTVRFYGNAMPLHLSVLW